MKVIESINSLSFKNFKSCSYEGIDNDDGVYRWVTESGIPSNIVRWHSHKYTLILQALTREERDNIIIELLETEEEGKRAIIYSSKITKVGYSDFKQK